MDGTLEKISLPAPAQKGRSVKLKDNACSLCGGYLLQSSYSALDLVGKTGAGMRAVNVSLLVDPTTGEPLSHTPAATVDVIDGALVSAVSRRRYAVRDGIPIFIDPADVTGLNKKYMGLYDSLAPFYDLPYKAYNLFSRGGVARVRLEYLRELVIGPGDHVLEISIGTGANLPYLPADADYFGLDISWGMLKKCRRNLKRWNRSAELFLGEAERLPFADAVFDAVFHTGGINFFNDKAAAINEMIRVAKPGTKIVVVDETEEYAAKRYRKTPRVGRFFKDRAEPILPPVALVPADMEDIRFDDIGGRLYRLTFRKPLRGRRH